MKKFLLTMALAMTGPVQAETIEYAGVLGNSGMAGETLVRVNLAQRSNDGSGVRSGVHVDHEARVWLSGGDAFNCLSLDGRLRRRYPLVPSGSRLDTSSFAALDGVLYAFGHLPKQDPKTRTDTVLFALPMAGDTVQVAARFDEYVPHRNGVLCPTPHDGKLLFAYADKEDAKRIVIGTFDPRSQTKATLLELPGVSPTALAIDPDGQAFYLGGFFGQYVGANHHHPNVCEIVKFTWEGKELWRRMCLDTPAEPTQFRGVISYAGDALWDTAGYGFLARFDRNGVTAPGKIASWDMRMPYVTQILDVHRSMNLLPARGVAEMLDPLLLGCVTPQHAYLAVWDDTSKALTLETRYGSLPELGQVSLSQDGWVNAGGLWWRFDDAANAAPRFANHAPACSPGAWRGDWVCAMTLGEKATPCVGRPAFGRATAQISHGELAPFSQVRGFAVMSSRGTSDAIAYATEGSSNRIWRSTMDPRTWAPRKNWKALNISGIASPGDLAFLEDGSLAMIDGGSVVRLEISGDTLKETARLARWGQTPDQALGQHLRLAAEGQRLVISDADHHRVVLMNAGTFQPVAQFGITDQAGASERLLASPGSIALAGNRAVVADVGNQRIVKLEIK